MKTMPFAPLASFLLVLAFVPLHEAAARTYTTNFPLTENPISEAGNWINGGSVGLDWSNVSTTPGFARGQQIPDRGGALNYNDSTALVSGIWGPDQTVQVVVRNANTGPGGMEVEIRLRSTIAAHNATGYEVNWSAQSTNPYLNIARWNGPLGSYPKSRPGHARCHHTHGGRFDGKHRWHRHHSVDKWRSETEVRHRKRLS